MKIRTVWISLILLVLFIQSSLYLPISHKKLEPYPVISLRLYDRGGLLMREVLSDEGGRCQWLTLEEIPLALLLMTVAAEDKNFFRHPGLDIGAVFRALVQNISKQRIVSGASTITQQLVRNIYHSQRNLVSKLFEIWISIRMERCLSKEEILVQYLNRICYGNQTYGIAAASRFYFDKDPGDLSLAESAFLAGLPRSPSGYNPLRFFDKAKNRQMAVLRQACKRGYIDSDDLSRARQEPICIEHASQSFRAPHYCDHVLKDIPREDRRRLSVIQTTIDLPFQENVEKMMNNHLDSLRGNNITNAAVVVINNHTGDILCMIGSKDFFDFRIDGQVNGATSLRQPGSTLKPFTYALALESGMTAATLLHDDDTFFSTPSGTFRPQNYDKTFHGAIRLRTALACSYNIPAVSVLQTLGSDLLYRKLHEAGFSSLQNSPEHYGIGLTLGSGEVTLLELVRAYASLARGGLTLQTNSILTAQDHTGKKVIFSEKENPSRIFPQLTSYIITHILSDKDARVPAFGFHSPLEFPFPCAAKTGTSKDFRDNWTLGYTPNHTVGVWVGNFDGKSMNNISGISGCGPLFHDVMLLLNRGREESFFLKPQGLVSCSICPVSGKLVTDACPGAVEEIFFPGTQPSHMCSVHNTSSSLSEVTSLPSISATYTQKDIKILFPFDGDVFKMDPVLRREYQIIRLKASVPTSFPYSSLEWRLNGKKIGLSRYPHAISWALKPGSYLLEIATTLKKEEQMTKKIRFKVLQ